MNTITVKICMGTTCFVMGASSLQELTDIIPSRYGEKVEVQGVPCLEFCNASTEARAPYVKVDDKVVMNATVEKVIEEIERKLNNG